MVSGYHKLFNAERHRSFVDELKGLGVPALAGNCAYWASLLDNNGCGSSRMDGFYKNLGIMGGFLLLYINGAGKYSIDALCDIAAP